MDMSLPLCVACILLVRAGHLLFQAGVTRSRNAASAVIRLICEMSVTALGFWVIGAAILLQDDNAVIGFAPSLIASDSVAVLAYLALVLCGTAQVTGAIAERSRFVVVPLLAVLGAVLIIPIVGHLTWAGLLKDAGVVDIGGAIPLHVTALAMAIVAARVIGPRQGKYNRDGSCNTVPGHALPLAGVGALLLVAGWIAYLLLANVMWHDVPLSRVVLGALLAAMAGALSAMSFSAYRLGKPDVMLTLLGMIAGAAATTAGAGLLDAWACVVLGLLAGVAGPWLALWLDLRWRIDDATGLAPAIGAGAIISAILSPLLITGSLRERLAGAGLNLTAVLLAGIIASLATWLTLAVVFRRMKLRVSEADEFDGLDLAEHDVNAYADFQQTMIKSHHLRQA